MSRSVHKFQELNFLHCNGFEHEVKDWTEMEIQCVIGMYRLKLISSENNSVFKGLILHRHTGSEQHEE